MKKKNERKFLVLLFFSIPSIEISKFFELLISYLHSLNLPRIINHNIK